ncbi:protein translocase subunit SecF [Candidatus Venteria ishoeyi]|uniref:Protein-export membrane protein SecF n=1 Tax=Candidatus Venteria ishoeyi TaxID=1899563 RepID=A0A1H6FCJ5_9GAMM|nr:protein translocase subunit SecF [Candidatus Venteria ishoeyi]SEH06876.1 preprotein translocase subunit SecF [Candidatus Venteria ishoeyi]
MAILRFNQTNFNFRFLEPHNIKKAMVVSAALILISIGSLIVQGLNFGLDFTGGTLVEVGYEQAADLEKIRAQLSAGGYADAVVQHFGTDKEVLIRLGVHADKKNDVLSNEVLALLRADGATIKMRRAEFVGPQVGKELVEDGGLAILYTLIGLLIYVTLRFEKRFSVGAVVALVHDSLITLGFFSLFQWEFDLTVLAAVLAIIGYSLNDTIVVFDRIRDNFLKLRKGTPTEVMNISINQTLIRTLVTSITTLLVVLALFFLGGELIHNFAAALIIGIIVGTYSSIYVASAITLKLGLTKLDLMPVEKEGEDMDDLEQMP